MSWSFRAVFLLPGQESRRRSQKGPGETFEASPSSFPQRDAVADDLKIILKMECLEKIMSTIRKLFSVLVNLCQGLFNWKAKGLIFDLNPISKGIGHNDTSTRPQDIFPGFRHGPPTPQPTRQTPRRLFS